MAVHELFVQGALNSVDKCFLSAAGAKSRTQWFEGGRRGSSFGGLGWTRGGAVGCIGEAWAANRESVPGDSVISISVGMTHCQPVPWRCRVSLFRGAHTQGHQRGAASGATQGVTSLPASCDQFATISVSKLIAFAPVRKSCAGAC